MLEFKDLKPNDVVLLKIAKTDITTVSKILPGKFKDVLFDEFFDFDSKSFDTGEIHEVNTNVYYFIIKRLPIEYFELLKGLYDY